MDSRAQEGSPPGELSRGALVGGYKIRQRIGVGSTGTVYSAVHPSSGRKVAIKLIHRHLARPDSLKRFEEESQSISGLHHPGIISLIDLGRLPEGDVFVISEYAKGRALTELLEANRPLAADSIRPLLEALALVLAIAHGHEVVHGGLTPANIWITPREDGGWPPLVRIMDFGMAVLRQSDVLAVSEEPSASFPHARDSFCYLSPEQCRAEPALDTSDIYALGVIGYQLLTGQLPFASESPADVIRMHLEELPRPPTQLAPSLPGAVDGVLMKCLAKQPSDRFQTMLQLRQALQSFRSPALMAMDSGSYTPASKEQTERAPLAAPDLEDDPPAELAATEQLSGEPPSRPARRRSLREILFPSSPPPARSPAARDSARDWDDPTPRTTSSEWEGVTARLRITRRGDAKRAPSDNELEPRPAPRLLGPLLAALLGVVLAAVVGAAGYRLLAGRWPGLALAPEEAPRGRLTIISTPKGATVYLNNVLQRHVTPLTVPSLVRGQTYQVSVYLAGHRPWQQTIALGLTEQERQLSVTLAEQPPGWGTVRISANRPADFFLDGRRVATQGQEVTLAEVRSGVDHELRVDGVDLEPIKQHLRVEPGKTLVLFFDLEAEHRSAKRASGARGDKSR